MKLLDRRTFFQRIPQAIGAGGKAAIGLVQTFCQPLIFVFLLERRIDQNEAALLLRRQVSAERKPAIEFRYPRLIVPLE